MISMMSSSLSLVETRTLTWKKERRKYLVLLFHLCSFTFFASASNIFFRQPSSHPSQHNHSPTSLPTMKLTARSSSVAASSPNSLGSDAMEESDSEGEDDAPARPTEVPYPLEGKYIDEADKRQIMSMSQLDREEILGQRAEEMSKANFAAELARRAAMQNERKRKADSEEPEDSLHKSSRPKVQPRKNEKLEAYKREREQRGQQRQRHDDRRNGRRRSSSGGRSGASDVDADGESDVEWDDRGPEKAHVELPATLRDFESVRVGRGFFSEVCFYPGFQIAMTGTFGRIGVGQDASRRTLYKMAQIKGKQTIKHK